MSECIEYGKYFFDFIDGVISDEKKAYYSDHKDLCSYCTDMYRLHLLYKAASDEFKTMYCIPEETDARLIKNLSALKKSEKRNAIIDAIGLISINELIDIFELDEDEERKLMENEFTFRIKKEFYIKKENLRDVLSGLSSENKPDLSGLFEMDGLDKNFINEFLLASNDID
jgi:hypothetical protein